MKRALPPAGHQISLKSIFRAFKNGPDFFRFLEKMNLKVNPLFLSSGTAALTFSLTTLKKESARKEVILPAYSCPSVLASVIKAGLVPVLCDLNHRSFQMNLDHLSSKIGSKTLAVIAVHLFGIPEDVFAIKKITGAKGAFLVEDAAQAFGNRYPVECLPSAFERTPNQDFPVGTIGDVGIFSFGRGKPFSLLTGGSVAVNNPSLRQAAEDHYGHVPVAGQMRQISYLLNLMLYSVFFDPRFYSIPARIPYLKLGETIFSLDFDVERMCPAGVRLGNKLFPDFAEIRKRRLALMADYMENLKELREEFYYFPNFVGEETVLLRFPLVLKDSEKKRRILEKLKKAGMGVTGMYPVSLDQQDGAKAYLNSNEIFPISSLVAEGILTLPLHEFVAAKDVALMHRIIKGYL